MSRRPIDFQLLREVEADYRAGMLSLRSIAAKHHISEALVRKWAKKAVDPQGKPCPWTRDLAPAVHARIREILTVHPERSAAHVRAAVRTPHDEVEVKANVLDETAVVDESARTAVEVVRSHRASIDRAQRVLARLFDQLDTASDCRGLNNSQGHLASAQVRAAMRNLVSLTDHASTLLHLTSALQRLTALERQAFGIADLDPSPAKSAIPSYSEDEFARIRERVAVSLQRC